jgi:hypothetical protein
MASTIPYTMVSAYDVVLFGNHCKRRYSFETGRELPEHQKILRPEEICIIRERAFNSDLQVAAAFFAKLNLRIDFYTEVRTQLLSLLRAWDAIYDEKSRYDMGGWQVRDRDFMESFLLGLKIIPERTGIGFLGPFSWEASQVKEKSMTEVGGIRANTEGYDLPDYKEGDISEAARLSEINPVLARDSDRSGRSTIESDSFLNDFEFPELFGKAIGSGTFEDMVGFGDDDDDGDEYEPEFFRIDTDDEVE